LRKGSRGLPGGSSLAQLLAKHRGVRNSQRLPRLSVRRILGWARRHRQKTGKWPSMHSGPIARTTGETWASVDRALRNGRRGLPGGMSVASLRGS
jgi:hypothetical protein